MKEMVFDVEKLQKLTGISIGGPGEWKHCASEEDCDGKTFVIFLH